MKVRKAKPAAQAPAPEAPQGRQLPQTITHNRRTKAEKQVMRKKALKLLLKGATNMQIAEELKLSTKTVTRYLDYAIEHYLPKRDVEQARKIALEKVSARELRTLGRLAKCETDSDYARLDLALTRAAEHRAKLEGTYAPQKHVVSFEKEVTQAQIHEMTDAELHRVAESGSLANGHAQPQSSEGRDRASAAPANGGSDRGTRPTH